MYLIFTTLFLFYLNNAYYVHADLASYVQGSTPPSLITPMQSALSFPVQDQDLHEKIVKQIDYYFRFFIISHI